MQKMFAANPGMPKDKIRSNLRVRFYEETVLDEKRVIKLTTRQGEKEIKKRNKERGRERNKI